MQSAARLFYKKILAKQTHSTKQIGLKSLKKNNSRRSWHCKNLKNYVSFFSSATSAPEASRLVMINQLGTCHRLNTFISISLSRFFSISRSFLSLFSLSLSEQSCLYKASLLHLISSKLLSNSLISEFLAAKTSKNRYKFALVFEIGHYYRTLFPLGTSWHLKHCALTLRQWAAVFCSNWCHLGWIRLKKCSARAQKCPLKRCPPCPDPTLAL